jgi:hypothetical protein
LQDAAHIPSASHDGYRGRSLFSEDLYSESRDVIIKK